MFVAVNANPKKGINEVDLMRLDIHKPTNYAGGAVTLTIKKGAAKLWWHSHKLDQVVAISPNVYEFTAVDWAGISKNTVWVEATDPSTTVRDIEIEASYAGAKDTVKATGIWSERDAVEHDKKTAAQVLADPKFVDIWGNPKLAIMSAGGTGLRPIPPNQAVMNVIFFLTGLNA